MKQQGFIGLAFLSVLVVIIGVIGWFVYDQKAKERAIDSYEKCAAAGGRIQESYPEVCRTKDGRAFTNPAQSVELPEAQ